MFGPVVETHRFTIARRHLADVPVDARHGSVIGPCGGFDLVADRCHPPTACALQNGLDGPSFGIGIAASPAKRQPAQAGEPQPVVLDADVLRNGDGVTAPALEARSACGPVEEPAPGIRLVLERVPHRRERHVLEPRCHPAEGR